VCNRPGVVDRRGRIMHRREPVDRNMEGEDPPGQATRGEGRAGHTTVVNQRDRTTVG
jgi:hypothetical protein